MRNLIRSCLLLHVFTTSMNQHGSVLLVSGVEEEIVNVALNVGYLDMFP